MFTLLTNSSTQSTGIKSIFFTRFYLFIGNSRPVGNKKWPSMISYTQTLFTLKKILKIIEWIRKFGPFKLDFLILLFAEDTYRSYKSFKKSLQTNNYVLSACSVLFSVYTDICCTRLNFIIIDRYRTLQQHYKVDPWHPTDIYTCQFVTELTNTESVHISLILNHYGYIEKYLILFKNICSQCTYAVELS